MKDAVSARCVALSAWDVGTGWAWGSGVLACTLPTSPAPANTHSSQGTGADCASPTRAGFLGVPAPTWPKRIFDIPLLPAIGGGLSDHCVSGNQQQQVLRSCSDTQHIGASARAPGESVATSSVAVAGACRSRSACLPHLPEPYASAAWVASAWGKLTPPASAVFEASHPLGLQHH